MPEMKRNFIAGKMNKDLDERLVPPGEYRDAMNVQVSTSEESSVGTIQNILGNSNIQWTNNGVPVALSSDSICIGSISDEKNDTLYWFVREPIDPNYTTALYGTQTWGNGIIKRRNLILQHKENQITPVFVDIAECYVVGSLNTDTLITGDINITTTDAFNFINIGDTIGFIYSTGSSGMVSSISAKVQSKNLIQKTINVGTGFANSNVSGSSSIYNEGGVYLQVNRERQTLSFGTNMITAINIIDDMLFWTDGITEPKKINIPRSIQGTDATGDFHTLIVNEGQNLPAAPNPAGFPTPIAEQKHITVIKKSPQNVLTVKTETSPDFGFGVTSDTTTFLIDPANPVQGNLFSGELFNIALTSDPSAVNILPVVGDIILFNPTDESQGPEDEHVVKVVLVQLYSSGVLNPQIPNGYVTNWQAEVISIDSVISQEPQQYNWAIDWDRKTKFKDKFPRFSYRYKYQDGEYSIFAPFTNTIFEPGNFVYDVQDAYNIGMENRITKITLSNYDKNLPEDVKSIDLLYKESNSAVVYTVDTIDVENLPNLFSNPSSSMISYEVKPNQIKAALTENQLLRAFDNVPRTSLAQEITGSRIVYANYLQNYNIQGNPKFQAYLNNRRNNDFNTGAFEGHKSLKSIRNYSLGISYLDKYGRQSPVFTNKQADIEIPIDRSDDLNQVSIEPVGYIPEWATHYKAFVKQVSNEYYNLAMDRVYDARDGNIWLSFPSSERNKVDEETFLILKKGVEEAPAVTESNKYKILAIANEAPTYIKTKRSYLAEIEENPVDVAATGNFTFFTNINGYPLDTRREIIVSKSEFDNSNVPLVDVDQIAVKFSKMMTLLNNNIPTGTTQKQVTETYVVTNFAVVQSAGSSVDEYKLVLEKPIKEQWLSDPNNSSQPDPSIGMIVYKDVVENLPEFDGRFFVKVSRDILIDDYIVSEAVKQLIVQPTTTTSLPFYYLSDTSNPDISVTGTTESIHSTGKTNSKQEWVDVLSPEGVGMQSFWFIDACYYKGYWEDDGTLQKIGMIGVGDGPQAQDANGDSLDGWSHFQTTGTLQPVSKFTEGYNKGIYEENGQMYIDLSYGFLLPASGSGNTAGHSFSLHTDGTVGVTSTKNALTGGYGPRFLQDETQDPCVGGCWFQQMGDNRSPGNSRWKNKDDLIKHWKVGSSLNPSHDTPQNRDIVQKLVQGSEFVFAGDPSNTIYRITDNPTLTYHLNFKDLSGYYSEAGDFWSNWYQAGYLSGYPAGPLGNAYNSGYLQGNGWSNKLKDVFNELNEVGQAKNRRVTYKIPIEAVDPNNPNNPTSPNSTYNPINTTNGADATDVGTIQFLEPEWTSVDGQVIPKNPAIWETEPKQDIDLDIYYEIGGAFPLEINEQTNNSFAPPGTIVTLSDMTRLPSGVDTVVLQWQPPLSTGIGGQTKSNVVLISEDLLISDGTPAAANWDQTIIFHRPDGSTVRGTMISWPNGYGTGGNAYATQIEIDPDVSHQPIDLSWFNCYSFENGVESDRIRDDFNQVKIDKGVKASSTLDEPYEEEQRKYGLIYSGLYNSISGVNNLNQFIQAEKITKDINPIYGSIQKLHSRSTADGDLIVLCEDRILKILANKDAVFNADGNTNLTATAKVLGQALPYSGQYGISKNPESFASESYRVYFTDKVRGAVIRLSKDGLTPISDYGMKDWFRDNIKLSNKLIGSYDDKKNQYNITLDNSTNGLPKTVSFSEDVKGWVSFKSFIPENGISCANEYYTFFNGKIYLHHSEDVDRNTFYSDVLQTSFTSSSVDFIFNEQPGSVKSFKTINYEGSQAKVNKVLDNNNVIVKDNQYFNLKDVKGWYAGTIFTDLEIGSLTDFIEKEGKWFGHIVGEDVNINTSGTITDNFDTSDFSIQGIGVASGITSSIVFGCTDPTAFNYLPAATNDDGSCVPVVLGCMDQNAHPNSYNPLANTDDGSCLYYGCTDSTTLAWASGYLMINYDPTANFDDGSCITAIIGCLDGLAVNYNPSANASCGGDYPLQGDPMGQPANYCCEAEFLGCLDLTATADNYDPAVNVDDGSCTWTGCTDPLALNYAFAGSFNPVVNGTTGDPADLVYLNGVAIPDGNCIYPGGCTDPAACNYDPTPGIVDNGSCTYCGDATTTGVINYDGGSCNNGCLYCDCPTIVPTISINPSESINGVDQYNGNVIVGFTESTNAFEYRIVMAAGPMSGLTFNVGSSLGTYSFSTGGVQGTLTATGFGSGTIEVEITNLSAGTYQFYVTAICNDLGNNPHAFAGGLIDCGNYNAQPFPILGPDDTFIIVSNDITPGCTDVTACNYNPAAVVDDGSCVAAINCTGCTDVAYLEFCNTCWDSVNNVAVTSGGGPWVFSDNANLCTTLIVAGCTDPAAFNFDPFANVDDGSCVAVLLGCTDSTVNNDGSYASSNFNINANTDDGSCLPYNCPIISSNSSLSTINSYYQIKYDVSNTPYSANLIAGGLPDPSNLAAFFVFADNNGVVNSGNGQYHYGGGSSANAQGLGGFNSGSNYIVSKTFSFGNFGSSNTNEIGVLNNNLTSITVGFTITTTDGNCLTPFSEVLSIGCNDATATNSGSAVNGVDFNITDNSQCIYAGCMDATPNTDGVGFFATNYDPNVGAPCQINAAGTLSGDNACCSYPGGTRREWTAFNDLSTQGNGYSALLIADDYSGTAFTRTDHYMQPGNSQPPSIVFTGEYDGTANNSTGTPLVPVTNSFAGLINSNTDAEGLPIAGVLQADCSTTAASSIQNVPCIEWGPYLVIDQITQTATLNVRDIARDYRGSGTQGSVIIDNAARNNQIGPMVNTTLIDETYTVGCKTGGYNNSQSGAGASYWNQTNQVDLNDSSMCILAVQGCADPNATTQSLIGGLGTFGFYDPTVTVNCDGTVVANNGVNEGCCCYDCATPGFGVQFADNFVSNTSGTGASHLDLHWTTVPYARHYIVEFNRTDVPTSQQSVGSRASFIVDSTTPGFSTGDITIDADYIYQNISNATIHLGLDTASQQGMFIKNKEYRFFIKADCDTTFVDPNDPTNTFLNQCAFPNEHVSGEDNASVAIQI